MFETILLRYIGSGAQRVKESLLYTHDHYLTNAIFFQHQCFVPTNTMYDITGNTIIQAPIGRKIWQLEKFIKFDDDYDNHDDDDDDDNNRVHLMDIFSLIHYNQMRWNKHTRHTTMPKNDNAKIACYLPIISRKRSTAMSLVERAHCYIGS